MAQAHREVRVMRGSIVNICATGDARFRDGAFHGSVNVRFTLGFQFRYQSLGKAQIDLARQIERERPITVETRRTAQLHVRVRPVDMRLFDAHFVAVISDPDGAVVLELYKLIVKRNVGNVHFHFDSVGLPKRAGNCEFAIYGAWAGQIFQMEASGDEGIEIELRCGKSSGNLLISSQSEVKLAR